MVDPLGGYSLGALEAVDRDSRGAPFDVLAGRPLKQKPFAVDPILLDQPLISERPKRAIGEVRDGA